jgi:hypothetical protein
MMSENPNVYRFYIHSARILEDTKRLMENAAAADNKALVAAYDRAEIMLFNIRQEEYGIRSTTEGWTQESRDKLEESRLLRNEFARIRDDLRGLIIGRMRGCPA